MIAVPKKSSLMQTPAGAPGRLFSPSTGRNQKLRDKYAYRPAHTGLAGDAAALVRAP